MGDGTEVVDQTKTEVDAGKTDTPGTETDTDAASEAAAAAAAAKETDDSGKDREAVTFMQNLLDTYGVESPDQLNEFISDLSEIKDALGDEDLQDLLDNKKLMLQYHAQWNAAEEAKKREGETPEETIKRLEQKLSEGENAAAQERQRQEDRKENDKLISGFNAFVSNGVDALKIADYLKDPLKKYLGVENPIHDIDLSNKVGIKKMIGEAGKAFEALEQAILKNAKLKKEGVPPMTETETQVASPGTDENEPKNLKDARKQATAILKQKLSRS